MDIQKEREAFESKLKQIGKVDDSNFTVAADGSYEWDSIHFAWTIWQAAKAQAVPEWVSVEDRLPPANILVLGMSQTPRNIFNIYNVMALDEFEEADVTHWMPLPDAPQEPAND